jgi:hypothetical protein
MITSRFRELMVRGFSLSNKISFKEFNESEFDRWIEDCQNLLSACEPEPYFPIFPDRRHIEEIVFLLQKVSGEILRGHTQYTGIF